MKVLEPKRIAIKNILFATDFEIAAARALPFAVALVDHYQADFHVAHVIPPDACVYPHPESSERIPKRAQSNAEDAMHQLLALEHHGAHCDMLLGEGDVAATLTDFARQCSADLVILGANSRSEPDKMMLDLVAEKLIQEAPCPVLAVGPRVTTQASAGIHSIVYASDSSTVLLRAAKLAISLADGYQASLTLMHVLEGSLSHAPRFAMKTAEEQLREAIRSEAELQFEPELLVEIGPVAERILNAAADFWAELIVIGVRGAGASTHPTSHFGSNTHEVISLATCPVLTVTAGAIS